MKNHTFFYYLKEKLKNPFNFIMAFCLVVLILLISIMFGYSIRTNNLIVASSKDQNLAYYLVEVGVEKDYDEATKIALEVQRLGGAGYIRYDDGFHIFASAYVNEKDAKSVLNNLTSYEYKKIYTLNLDEFNFDNGFGDGMNQIFKNNILSYRHSIENMTNLIIKLDKNEMSVDEVKNNVLIILEEIEQQNERFFENFSQNKLMYKYKTYIIEFKNYFDRIMTLTDDKTEFSRILKFQNISCMFCLDKILKLV